MPKLFSLESYPGGTPKTCTRKHHIITFIFTLLCTKCPECRYIKVHVCEVIYKFVIDNRCFRWDGLHLKNYGRKVCCDELSNKIKKCMSPVVRNGMYMYMPPAELQKLWTKKRVKRKEESSQARPLPEVLHRHTVPASASSLPEVFHGHTVPASASSLPEVFHGHTVPASTSSLPEVFHGHTLPASASSLLEVFHGHTVPASASSLPEVFLLFLFLRFLLFLNPAGNE